MPFKPQSLQTVHNLNKKRKVASHDLLLVLAKEANVSFCLMWIKPLCLRPDMCLSTRVSSSNLLYLSLNADLPSKLLPTQSETDCYPASVAKLDIKVEEIKILKMSEVAAGQISPARFVDSGR